MRRGPIAVEMQEEIQNDYRAGMTRDSLAKKYGRKPDTILKVLAKMPNAVLEQPIEFANCVIGSAEVGDFSLRLPIGTTLATQSLILFQIEHHLRQPLEVEHASL